MVPYDRRVELRDHDLLLRPIEARDAAGLVDGLDDPETVKFMLAIPSPYTTEDAQDWVERCATAWRTGAAYPFAIVDSESGALLGSIELQGNTIGYWVARDAWGRGIATRALKLVCEWASERPLRLTTHPDNIGSQRVAERAGFRRVGTTTHDVPIEDGTREAFLFELR